MRCCAIGLLPDAQYRSETAFYKCAQLLRKTVLLTAHRQKWAPVLEIFPGCKPVERIDAAWSEAEMQGIFFFEFVEMVEGTFSIEIANLIVEESVLPSGGVYTAGGTYDHRELLQLVDKLSEKTGTGVEELMRSFGSYLFERLSLRYPDFLKGSATAFDFLSRIEEHIHTEVRKLYPASELATFDTVKPDSDTLLMTYSSQRPFGALALGLMQGCCRHFGENIDIVQQDLSTGGVNQILFTLTRHCHHGIE